jgi:hypothetical protein
MLSIRMLIAAALFMAGFAGVISFGHNTNPGGDCETEQLVTIKGKAVILNHPELGRTVASHTSIVFQRTDCKKCLVAAVTDANGDYEIYVGRGRYKISYCDARGGGAPSYDMLAPDQPRYVNADSILQPNQFDISIVIPSRK